MEVIKLLKTMYMCSPQSWRLGRTLEFALSLDTQYLCSRLEQSIAGFPDFGRVSNFGGGRSNQSILSNVAVQSCTLKTLETRA